MSSRCRSSAWRNIYYQSLTKRALHFILKNKDRSGRGEKNERRGASDKRESKTHLELADIKKNAEWVVFLKQIKTAAEDRGCRTLRIDVL